VSVTSPVIDPVYDMAKGPAHARRMGVDVETIELASPLVVLGAHGHTEVEHPPLGPASLAVVRNSPHPVLVMPAHAAR
jgi:hypothetical protein